MMRNFVVAAMALTVSLAGAQAEERYDSPIHFRPAEGRLADTIPFYWNGEYHIFYLRAIEKVPWEHIVSTDLIHWKELPTALRSDGAEDGPDGFHMFTGSVTEHDGTFHIFYTGWNPKNKDGREKIMHATSEDLVTWTKRPEDGFFGDGVRYENTDFRDPFLYWNKDENAFWMILCARDAKTSKPVQGVARSKDLKTWEQIEPLLLDPPLGEGTPECPDVFTIGDTYYLIHSPSAGTTDMRYAKELRGPYRVPETPSIDTPILYAAKRMFDGKRHVITGWIRDLKDEKDGGEFQWGGDQSVPREVYAGPEGMLYFKAAPEALAVFNKAALTFAETVDLRELMRVDVPEHYFFEGRFQMDPDAELTLRMRAPVSASEGPGYSLTIRPGKSEAELSGAKFTYARPVKVDTTKPVKVQAFVQGTIIECFINDAYAFSCRAYDFRGGELMLVPAGNVKLLGLEVKVNE